MKNQTFTTHSAEETRALGAKLARTFKGGYVVLLEGDLGAGKTHFVQGVSRGLGVKKNITSPTFTLMNVYNIPRTTKHLVTQLAHIDLYRLKTLDEAYAIGVMDYIGNPSTLTLIEWPKKIKNALPKGCARVCIDIKTSQKNSRTFVVMSQ